MIKRTIGNLFALATVALLAATILHYGSYTSLVKERREFRTEADMLPTAEPAANAQPEEDASEADPAEEGEEKSLRPE